MEFMDQLYFVVDTIPVAPPPTAPSPIEPTPGGGIWSRDSVLSGIYQLYGMFMEAVGAGRGSRRCLILDVPEEILLVLAEHLDLCDLFFLAQTCKTLRRILNRDWESEVSRADRDGRLSFYEGLAWNWPNFYACQDCARLHGIYPQESPLKLQLGCNNRYSRLQNRFKAQWRLRNYHVQMALKFDRLGIEEEYKRDLLEGYKTWTFVEETLNLVWFYKSRCKIVQGRFALCEEWIFMKLDGGDTISRANLGQGPFGVCPHQMLVYDRSGSPDFERLVEKSLATPGQVFEGSCDCCWTDYMFILHEPHQMRFLIFRDLGNTGSGFDPHISKIIASLENGTWKRSPVVRTFGASKELYMNGRVIGD